MDNILVELQDLFRDILDQPDLVLTRESDATTVEDWDSLSHVNLITSIERRYNIKFSLSELEKMKSVGDIVDLIHGKLKAA